MSSGTGFFGSPIYKKVMSKVYGIGAAVAITGALFKIQHFKGAGLMLTLGLGAEAVIFFLSAFEPPHEMPDWSLVYPELVGLENDEPAIGTSSLAAPGIETYSISQAGQLEPGAIAKLGDGINTFAQTIDQLAGLSEISAATTAYLASLRTASNSIDSLTEVQTETTNNIRLSSGALNESYSIAAKAVADSGMAVSESIVKSGGNLVESIAKSGENLVASVEMSGRQLNDVYKTYGQTVSNQVEQISAIYAQSNQEVSQSSHALSQSYAEAAKSVAEGGIKVSEALSKSGDNIVEAVQTSGKQLTVVYNSLEQTVSKQIEQIATGANEYNNNIQNTNSKLSAINSVYELHLASINNQVNEVNKLAQTLGELNTIYGNMLNVLGG